MIHDKPLTAENYRHMAAVYRREADVRLPNDPHFGGWLSALAEKCERQAIAADSPEQPDLFGAAA